MYLAGPWKAADEEDIADITAFKRWVQIELLKSVLKLVFLISKRSLKAIPQQELKKNSLVMV